MVTKIAALPASSPTSTWSTALLAHGCEADEELDYLTHDAAQLLEAPIAIITVVTPDALIFKSCVGSTQGSHMRRKGSFCALAVSQDGILAIPDTHKDARFKNNQLVTGPSNIRAYLGIPLKAPDGSIIGTLCIMDTKPRKFAKHQRSLLTVMATSAENHLTQNHT